MLFSGSLLRKYVAYFATLVTFALIVSGGVGLFFSYLESKNNLLNLQREKALAAASRIETYIAEVEHQIGWMQLPQSVPLSLEQRRLEYIKLLRQAPAITEIVQLDKKGAVKLRVSRLAMNTVGGVEDLSNDPRFTVPKSGKIYYSPIYFRKDTEPYITIAMAGISDDTGITIAEVNLKFIWEVISRIKIGEEGLAYVIDAKGHLIAHPDISLVLKKSDLSFLPQTQLAISQVPGKSEEANIGQNLQGGHVLTAYASIKSLGWHVFVEQPIAEAFKPLYDAFIGTFILLFAGLGLSVMASVLVARRMINPIQAIKQGAERIGTGNLDQDILVSTGDELQTLAEQFNTMSRRLRNSYAELENKVIERTQELSLTLEQQTATGQILSVISNSPSDLQPVLDAIVNSSRHLFECNAVEVLILQDDQIIRPAFYCSSDLLDSQDLYPSSLDLRSLAGQAILENKFIHLSDVLLEGDAAEHTLTAATKLGLRALMLAPIKRENSVFGVIAIGRISPGFFVENQVSLLKTFADQAAISIVNTRQFNELDKAKAEAQRAAQTLKELSENLSRYVSPQIYQKIFKDENKVVPNSQRKKLTIFFSDIVGFTQITDELESEDLTDFLNEYLNAMASIALQYGATIDKFIGDAVMIFFGDPESRGLANDAKACVDMAIEMQQYVSVNSPKWVQRHSLNKSLEIRIGINTGYCTVGNFGSDERLDYTVLGGTVNLASRLEGAARPGSILVSNETQKLTQDYFEFSAAKSYSLKGLSSQVTAFEVISPRSMDSPALLSTENISVAMKSGQISREEIVKVMQFLEDRVASV
jgi:class 3 adenylate cyclase/HAMP domain-containing protein